MRTFDMLQIAPVYAQRHADFFSLEMWGGATFDTSLRFLKEDPWQRLADLRERIPNILFQMLLRANNAVGYTNYPDNVVKAVHQGIGPGRHRRVSHLRRPQLAAEPEAGHRSGPQRGHALRAGHLLHRRHPRSEAGTKYSLKYYVDLAKELEKMGANLLAIKDMAGLCKPYAAQLLVRTLKQEIGIPIHFHTHDSRRRPDRLAAARPREEGVDIVDAAMGPLSGMTSQPSLNTLVECLRFTERDTGMDFDDSADDRRLLGRGAPLLSAVRIAASWPPSAEVYRHEMPGGQYTNLYQQAQASGVEARWSGVCRMYAEVNRLFGDIVKVTPTSKVVGDMALFMVANNLTPEEVESGKRELAFPESVVEFFEGKLGQPVGGFPPKPASARAEGPQADDGTGPAPVCRRPISRHAQAAGRAAASTRRSDRDVVTHLLYPRVYADFVTIRRNTATPAFCRRRSFSTAWRQGDEISVDIEEGKTLIIKFLTVGDPHLDGRRLVFFELNGQPREVLVVDKRAGRRGADASEGGGRATRSRSGAPMPGLVVRVNVAPGEQVTAGQKLVTLEAMKMETTVYAERRQGRGGACAAADADRGGGFAVAVRVQSGEPSSVRSRVEALRDCPAQPAPHGARLADRLWRLCRPCRPHHVQLCRVFRAIRLTSCQHSFTIYPR